MPKEQIIKIQLLPLNADNNLSPLDVDNEDNNSPPLKACNNLSPLNADNADTKSSPQNADNSDKNLFPSKCR